MQHYDVVFATPGPDMHRDYVKSLVASCAWLAEQGKTFTLLNRTSSFVASAREWTAVNSVGSDWTATRVGENQFTYDRMVWIDSDISWKVEDLEQLLSNNLDIVAGIMPIDRDGRVGMMRVRFGVPTIMSWTDIMFEDEVFEVDGVSFGFLAVKNGVFESMPRPWFKIRETSVEGYPPEFKVNFGEDYSWCMSAKEAGHKIWVDQRVKVTHHKENALEI